MVCYHHSPASPSASSPLATIRQTRRRPAPAESTLMTSDLKWTRTPAQACYPLAHHDPSPGRLFVPCLPSAVFLAHPQPDAKALVFSVVLEGIRRGLPSVLPAHLPARICQGLCHALGCFSLPVGAVCFRERPPCHDPLEESAQPLPVVGRSPPLPWTLAVSVQTDASDRRGSS